MVQQSFTGKKMNLKNAVLETFKRNIWNILILNLVWTILFMILCFIEGVLAKSNESGKEDDISLKGIATTLTTTDTSFSTQLILRLARMAAFLVMPAICWENLGFISAVKRGYKILRSNLAVFSSGYVFISIMTLFVMLPVSAFYGINSWMVKHLPEVSIPPTIWIFVIIYTGLAWCFIIYFEQIFTALIYLWHIKWEKEVKIAKKEGTPIPKLADVEMPIMLRKFKYVFKKF